MNHCDWKTSSKSLQQADSKVSGLLELVGDACRFIQTFGNGIANYPLQVYVSAIIFSPTQSITRRQFEKAAPKWIQTLPAGEAEWVPISRTYETGKRISSLAVSCCKTWIASSYEDAAITIWETYSGKTFRVLNASLNDLLTKRGRNASYFSPWNREELVSSYEVPGHYQLAVWDVTTGKALQQLRIEDHLVTSSFLGSAPHILGCLSRRFTWKGNKPGQIFTASIWNTETGQIIKKIQFEDWGSPRLAFCTFSPNGDNIIAGHREPYVDIINMNTASTMHILTDTIGVFNGMKFSPDCSSLALKKKISSGALSQPDIHVFMLLDTSSSEIIWSFQTKGFIYDFTFSPDGKLLAIASYQGVELLSTISGKCLRKIRISSTLLIFSSDGSKIFSAEDSVVSVIDIGQESFIDTGPDDNSLRKNIIDRCLVSLSPNGRLIASAFTNSPVIEVTDISSTNSTKFLRTPKCVDGYPPQLLFSPDSKTLVCIFEDSFVLGDISSEPTRTILTWEKNLDNIPSYIGCIFSLDSRCLAVTVSYEDGYHPLEIQVWDAGSGKKLMCLERRNEEFAFTHLCFSPDNKRLAMLYSDEDFAIRAEIWEIASVSAIQAIDLSWRDLYYDLHNCFQSSNLSPEVWELLNKEIEEDKYSMTLDSYGIPEVNYTEKGHLVLDLSYEPRRIDQLAGIRLALRTRVDLELTSEISSMIRFRKAKSYELDSEKTWIRFNGKRFVWIPPQYRRGAVHIERNCVTFHHHGRYLSILQFSHSELVKQIFPSHTSIMGNMPCVPDTEAFTYLRELGEDWHIMYRDLSEPCDKTMYTIVSTDEPDDEMMCEIESVGEIKDTSEGVAYEDIVENYSDWMWTVLGPSGTRRAHRELR